MAQVSEGEVWPYYAPNPLRGGATKGEGGDSGVRVQQRAGRAHARFRVNFGLGRDLSRRGSWGPTTLSLGRLAELRRAPARKRAGLSWLKGARGGKMS
jgi:hypothetical protein